jgi:hypothetical protein
MGEPARKIELTSSLSPKNPQFADKPEVLPRITPDLSDTSKVRRLTGADRARIKSRLHNPKERRLEQYAELKEKLETIERTRELLHAQLAELAEEEAMIKTGKIERDKKGNLLYGVGSMAQIEKVHRDKTGGEDIAAKEKAEHTKDLIKILSLSLSPVLGRRGLSKEIISALKRCENCDNNLISAILFIFGASGSHFDLESMDFSKLNPSRAPDRNAIEELSVFLNEKTIQAMNIIEDTLAEDRLASGIKKDIINKRIMLVEKALKDFRPVEAKYSENKDKNSGVYVHETPAVGDEEMGRIIDIPNEEVKEDAA